MWVEKNSFEVLLSDIYGDRLNILIHGVEHLVPLAAKGVPLVEGTQMDLRGLRRNAELNGVLARVVEFQGDSYKVEVLSTYRGQSF